MKTQFEFILYSAAARACIWLVNKRLVAAVIRGRERIWEDMPGRSHVKLWKHDALVILGVWAKRLVLFLVGLVLCVTGASSAQTSSTNPLLLAAPFSLSSSGAVSAAATSPSSTSYSPSLASLATSPGEPIANPFSS